ncbi:MAG TPA: hypothetical protein VK634_05180 [Reyranella sp.]|nr:hypothetical protein [Reyranella sp.]
MSKTKPSRSSPRKGETPSKRSKEDARQGEVDRRLDEELAESFPASDPPSILRSR